MDTGFVPYLEAVIGFAARRGEMIEYGRWKSLLVPQSATGKEHITGAG